ncbi:hypothetical protein DDB_G0269650 [Dictyostelium discoideum AX4]|uniref:Uncharacterized protein n=1 Tax=Dictyostelium discoideum TaxID=44689 RepID=Q55DI3_DICDI|nr:hypothetical protein DDB_G0269650 [Dictyostelium discoideum AX4]EAL72175.1 hypothetical protein DDB_G0269650 [Dictyostelium discoideum AX4]|eukprot:XP_646148.1 hypothetical protein DDB_G0269650 [Dictyostelium discoideum AX4]
MKRFSSLIRFGRILSSANPKENKFTNELQEIARNDSGLIAVCYTFIN